MFSDHTLDLVQICGEGKQNFGKKGKFLSQQKFASRWPLAGRPHLATMAQKHWAQHKGQA
jgi:hypothetical protein